MNDTTLLTSIATSATLLALLGGVMVGAAALAALISLASVNRSLRSFFVYTVIFFLGFCLVVGGALSVIGAPKNAVLKAHVRSMHTPLETAGNSLAVMAGPKLFDVFLIELALRGSAKAPSEFPAVQRRRFMAAATELENALPEVSALQSGPRMSAFTSCQKAIQALRDPLYFGPEVLKIWSLSNNIDVSNEAARLTRAELGLLDCASLDPSGYPRLP